MKRGQTATEYLVLVGGVIFFALFLFLILKGELLPHSVNQTGQAGGQFLDEFGKPYLFYDNFQTSTALRWQDSGGDWKVMNGKYEQDSASLGKAKATVGDSTWDNYAIQADVQILQNGNGNPASGLFVRSNDSSYYLCQISRPPNAADSPICYQQSDCKNNNCGLCRCAGSSDCYSGSCLNGFCRVDAAFGTYDSVCKPAAGTCTANKCKCDSNADCNSNNCPASGVCAGDSCTNQMQCKRAVRLNATYCTYGFSACECDAPGDCRSNNCLPTHVCGPNLADVHWRLVVWKCLEGKCINPQTVVLPDSFDKMGVGDLPPYGTHAIRVAVNKSQINCSVDGRPDQLVQYGDIDFPSGKAGLLTDGTGAAFDNVKVAGYPSQPFIPLTVSASSISRAASDCFGANGFGEATVRWYTNKPADGSVTLTTDNGYSSPYYNPALVLGLHEATFTGIRDICGAAGNLTARIVSRTNQQFETAIDLVWNDDTELCPLPSECGGGFGG